MRPFQVRVEGIQFAAAHFATFGGECEPLHGHNYTVAAEIDGTLSEDAWVVDFIALKSILRSLCDEVDHRFMLQGESSLLRSALQDKEWRIETPAGLVYHLPASDVVNLPLDNTTAERLAQWFCNRLWRVLRENDTANLQAATVEVWEGPDQRAAFRQESLPAD